jgi:hypothetical protein
MDGGGVVAPQWYVVLNYVGAVFLFPLILAFMMKGVIFWFSSWWGVAGLLLLAAVNSTIVTVVLRGGVWIVGWLRKRHRARA